ncbi:RNA pseudouridine synthase [Lentilactobacillus curieae]|uniref:Pseudouridine synthase n=1 Tax=Lentilactobacillus curieae TaxID=1138822 RepID=A0A1S6QI60_9LACO|nr:RluA family pseudouridine synthase [Lentilactobacillus curieae]AQW21292.1 RNA pseudouridine synthase [Lentilactobacillus curieae]
MKTQWHYNLIIPKSFPQTTLKEVLSNYYGLPKHLLYSVRKAERVTVNGNYLPVSFAVKGGDSIQLEFIPEDFESAFPTVLVDKSYQPQILYETDDVIVVNKRRGDKTHPNQPGENGATINQLAGYLDATGIVPYMIHRLDQETSGAIIFGKNPAVVPSLVDDIRHKVTERTYLAWVHGTFDSDHGTINSPIGKDPEDKRKRKVSTIDGQNAITHYQVCDSRNGYSLIQIKLETGRTHQIRVHMQSIGHPLVGDPLYSDDSFTHMLLHSQTIRFKLPFYRNWVSVEAPVPADFKSFINVQDK